MSREIGLGSYIENEFVRGKDFQIVSHNPAQNFAPVFETTSSLDHVDKAVESARKAYRTWNAMLMENRIDVLMRLKQAFLSHEQEIALAITREMGKILEESKTEARSLSDRIEITVNHGLKRVANEKPHGVLGETRYHAQGVLAVLGPFNFPAHLINSHVIPALLTGNTVVVKPSEICPLVGEIYARCVREANFPSGVFNLVQGDREIGHALAVHPKIDGVLFTGSYQTGRILREKLLDQPHKILALELGGKNFSIVLDDADLFQALVEVVQGSFLTTGQRCTATSRLLLHREIADRFITELISVTKTLKCGDPMFGETHLGPLATKSSFDRYLSLLENPRKENCEALLAFKTLSGGAFVTPSIHLLNSGKSEVKGYTDTELFGPDICIEIIDNIDNAITRVNQSAYGLSNALFTANKDNFERFYLETRSGVLNWNKSTSGASGLLPFGGIGKSGNQRPAGIDSVRYTTFPVAINTQHFGQSAPIKSLAANFESSIEKFAEPIEELIERHERETLLEQYGAISGPDNILSSSGATLSFSGLTQGSIPTALKADFSTMDRLRNSLETFADNNFAHVAGKKARAINLPPGGKLPRSEAMLRRLYQGEFTPHEKKPAVIDLHRSSGPYLSSIDDDPLIIFDAASQIATIGLGFGAGQFFDALDSGKFAQSLPANLPESIEAKQVIDEFSTWLVCKANGTVRHASFTDGGAMACEKAFDLCRINGPGGRRVIAFEGSFHGRTLMTLQATFNKEKRAPFEFEGYTVTFIPFPQNPTPHLEPAVTDEWITNWTSDNSSNFDHDPLIDSEISSLLTAKKEIEKGDVCAVIIEPMQCEGGDNYATSRFYNGLRALTRAMKIPLIFDEIQTGFCLGGPFFWHHKFALRDFQGKPDAPDCITLAKKAQVGVCLSAWPDTRPSVPHIIELQRGLIQAKAIDSFDVTALEMDIGARLARLQKRYPDLVSNVRNNGFAFAFDMPNGHITNQIINQRFYRGFMVYIAGEKTLRFRVNMATANHELEVLFHNIEEAIKTLLSSDNPDTFKAPEWIDAPHHPLHPHKLVKSPLDMNSITIELLTLKRWSDVENQIRAIEEDTYEQGRRNSMNEFQRWLSIDDSVCMLMRGNVSGAETILGYANGIPLEQSDVDGPKQDAMRGKDNSFYSANVTLAKQFRGLNLGFRLKKELVDQVRALRKKDGSPRYIFMVGRNRLGFTREMMNINYRLGAYDVAVYDHQYETKNAKAVYYRIRLRHPKSPTAYKKSTSSDVLDWASSIQAPLGTHPQTVVQKIVDGEFTGPVGTKLTLSNWTTPTVVRYTELLRRLMPKACKHTYFTSGQDETVDKGVRCLRVSRPKGQIMIGLERQFVGQSSAAARSLTDDTEMVQPFSWFDWPKIPHPNETSTSEAISKLNSLITHAGPNNVLGIVVELVGEKSGYLISNEFLTELDKIRAETGIPLAFVETASSFGRCSETFFLSDTLPIKPNMVWWYPGGQLGHVMVDDQYYVSKPLTLISTWDGDEISILRNHCHMIEAYRTVEDDTRNKFENALSDLSFNGKLHGKGFWKSLEFPNISQTQRAIESCLNNKLNVRAGIKNRLILCPPININLTEIEEGMARLNRALRKL